MKPDIKFPVLIIYDRLVSGIFTFDQLVTCNSRGLKSGYFNKLLLIDSNNRVFCINEAKKQKYIWNISGFIFCNPFIKVELKIDPKVTKISLANCKKNVLEAINKDPNFHCAVEDVENLKKKVLSARSVAEIAQLFRGSLKINLFGVSGDS